VRFVETPVFTEQIVAALDDDSYRQLQVALLLRPEQGALIRGSGGLRGSYAGRRRAEESAAEFASSTTGIPATKPSTCCARSRKTFKRI
jgi:hypothetical protein